MAKVLSPLQQRVLVSIVEGAGTTQRFGRWTRRSMDALQHAGLVNVTHIPTPPEAFAYALWRVDLTTEGRKARNVIPATVVPIPFAEYRLRTEEDSCLHDPLYPVGKWCCPLKRGHADFHRYYPIEMIRFIKTSAC
jgi:hypothetical protein